MNINLIDVPPIYLKDRVAAIEQAAILDETALFGSGTGVTTSDITLTALSLPANVAVTQGGTAGSTNYTYVVADVGNVGVAPAAGVQTTTGNATLSTTNTNIITWQGLTGHTYNIYRSASSGTPSGTGLIGTVSIPLAAGIPPGSPGVVGMAASGTFTDTGITATGNVPTTNNTGSISCPGPVFANGNVFMPISTTALNNSSGQTWTTAQTMGRFLVRSGAVTVSDTTPTAAQLVAAAKGAQVGQGWVMTLRNANTGTLTISAGTNVTLVAGNTNTIPTINARDLFFVFTNVTPGSEAVSMYTGVVSAF